MIAKTLGQDLPQEHATPVATALVHDYNMTGFLEVIYSYDFLYSILEAKSLVNTVFAHVRVSADTAECAPVPGPGLQEEVSKGFPHFNLCTSSSGRPLQPIQTYGLS